jgi:hypothetical protein
MLDELEHFIQRPHTKLLQPQSHSLLLEMVFGHAVAQRVSGHFEEPTGF